MNLAEELMEEIRRVRDHVMPAYLELEDKRASAFVLAMMRRDMDEAIRALAEQDAARCLAILPALKGYTL